MTSGQTAVRQASWESPTQSLAHSRPQSAQLSADLANFDSDADPDGWRAQVILRDRNDRPVIAKARAEFQLSPRIPTAGLQSYVDANIQPLTWRQEVRFDDDSVAHFRLPLRQPLQRLFGSYSSIYPRSGLGVGFRGNLSSGRFNSAYRGTGSQYLQTVVTGDRLNQLGRPEFGELRVKVSVPGEGVFRAVTVVPIRPPVLVDTHWPYR